MDFDNRIEMFHMEKAILIYICVNVTVLFIFEIFSGQFYFIYLYNKI